VPFARRRAPIDAVEYGQIVPTSRPPPWVNRLDELHLLTPLRILAIIVVAIVVAFVLRTVVARLLSRTIGLPGTDRTRAEARQRALSSALRSAVVGVVWATAIITIVSELGVNIGGVIATATVIGGAVAFGAQTLIRDVIAGLFVLAEDQYGVGDSVDLGYMTGEVERITLRSVRVRDGEGKVWHVAHGNVLCVANLSKAAIALLDLEVSRDSDLGVVAEVADRLAAQLREHPSAGAVLTADPTVVGVTEIRDDRLVYRVTVPTLPGKREEVRRAWRVLALDAFREGDLLAPPGPIVMAHIVSPPAPPDDSN
jgi:small-conductance mechanosensitive channel